MGCVLENISGYLSYKLYFSTKTANYFFQQKNNNKGQRVPRQSTFMHQAAGYSSHSTFRVEECGCVVMFTMITGHFSI